MFRVCSYIGTMVVGGGVILGTNTCNVRSLHRHDNSPPVVALDLWERRWGI